LIVVGLWNALGEVVKGPRQIMDWTRKLATCCNKHRSPISWVSPSGFRVIQAYPLMQLRRVTTRLGDKSVKLTVYKDLEALDPLKQAQSLAPNWIHSLDAACLHIAVE